MKIAASLSVKDEVELIEPAVHHLLAIGVDHIIACDMGSTDGTYQALEKYRSNDNFWLFQLDDTSGDRFDDHWARTNVALARSTDCDWILFADADEFWIPASGSLRDCPLLERADVLVVDRYNVPNVPGETAIMDGLRSANHDTLLLITETFEDGQSHMRNHPQDPIILAKQEPKLMARVDRIGALEAGGHDVIVGDSQPLRRAKPSDIVIAHVPFTSQDRFKRKVDNICNAWPAGQEPDDEALAWHWRRLLQLAHEGQLADEFGRNQFDGPTMEAYRRAGTVLSVTELFNRRINQEEWLHPRPENVAVSNVPNR